MFQYEPLTENLGIRLIELLPSSSPVQEIHCRLIHTTLPQCENDFFGEYTALSYVWGDPAKVKSVMINGQKLEIAENLFCALRDSRHQTRAFRLWVDGICINQLDETERAEQVTIMGDIYAGAHQTIIYLGPQEPGSPEIECLKAISNNQVEFNAHFNSSVKKILRKPWFTRVWVFQELVFSVKPWIQCGQFRVRWDKFYEVSWKSGQSLNVNQRNLATADLDRSVSQSHHIRTFPEYKIFSEMQSAREGHRSHKRGNSLLGLLRARRGLGVTDPRDMIYAHVGFSSERYGSITVDYSKTATQVYEEFARVTADKWNVIRILREAGTTESPGCVENLPSWVPDWTSTSPASFSLAGQTTSEALIDAYQVLLANQSIVAYISLETNTVCQVSSPLHIMDIPRAAWEHIQDVLNGFGYSQTPTREKRERRLEEIFRLYPMAFQVWSDLVRNEKILPSYQPGSEKAGIHGLTSSKYSPRFERIAPYPSSPERSSILEILFYALRADNNIDYVEGRAIARLDSGDLALVPGGTRVGDKVATTACVEERNGHQEMPIFSFVIRDLSNSDEKVELNSQIVEEMAQKCMECSYATLRMDTAYSTRCRLNSYLITTRANQDKSPSSVMQRMDYMTHGHRSKRVWEVNDSSSLEKAGESNSCVSVSHCTLIGECVRDGDIDSEDILKLVRSPKSFPIVALH